MAADVRKFLAENQTAVPAAAAAVQSAPAPSPKRLSYGVRAGLAENAAGKRLFEVMERKRTNLCVAADLLTCAAVLDLADKIGAASQPPLRRI